MLQVTSVLSGCCICFTHMLQLYVLNFWSVLDICCIQVFHIVSVWCCSESNETRWVMGTRTGVGCACGTRRQTGRAARKPHCFLRARQPSDAITRNWRPDTIKSFILLFVISRILARLSKIFPHVYVNGGGERAGVLWLHSTGLVGS
jgi:hypothetical protein